LQITLRRISIKARKSLDSVAFKVPKIEHVRLAGAGPIVCFDRIEIEQRSAGRGFLQEVRDILTVAERAAGLARETARGDEPPTLGRAGLAQSDRYVNARLCFQFSVIA
jgi:hypothetical protein